ncbi:MAG: hypothetical protein JNJ88_07620 [Planctomycetes bacterium]|nr:hypothetical protein [Planctomycetota bacterium]
MRRPTWLLLPVAMAATGCRSAPPPLPAPFQTTRGVVEASWRIEDPGGELAGYLTRTRYDFPQGSTLRFHVWNCDSQTVGFVDENGRAFRLVPFEEEPVLVATGSLEKGAGAILHFDRPARLRRISEAQWQDAAASRRSQ